MVGDRKTLSILQACQHVGVSRRTIYNWINSGKVEYVRTAGGIRADLRRLAVAQAGRAGRWPGRRRRSSTPPAA